jgi:hypothetical protein
MNARASDRRTEGYPRASSSEVGIQDGKGAGR